MTTLPRMMTADALSHLPDDGFVYKLAQGELRPRSPSGHRHGKIVINITLSRSGAMSASSNWAPCMQPRPALGSRLTRIPCALRMSP